LRIGRVSHSGELPSASTSQAVQSQSGRGYLVPE
jgi:hypothetical protein